MWIIANFYTQDVAERRNDPSKRNTLSKELCTLFSSRKSGSLSSIPDHIINIT